MPSSHLRTSAGIQLIDQWQASGMTQKAFCEWKGIGYARFHYWYAIYRSKACEQSRFISVEVTPPADTIVLCGTNGIRLQLSACTASAKFVKQILTV
jgi:elongation factor P hydroxylase